MIHFDVEFYREQRNAPRNRGGGSSKKRPHRRVIDHYKKFESQLKVKGMGTVLPLDQILKNGFDINEYDFIIYSLFRHQNNSRIGFQNHQQISDSAYERIKDFDSFYEFANSIRNTLTQKLGGADRMYSEYHGVSGSLVLTNKLFGLTNADYKGIRETGSRVLDFKYNLASNGINFIKIESKGVFGLPRRINKAANSIISKKKSNNYLNNKKDLFYGVVTQVPFKNQKGNAKCIIVDPPLEMLDIDPLKYRLHTRLSYYYNKISWFTGKSALIPLNKLINQIPFLNKKDWQNIYYKNVRDIEIIKNLSFISFRSSSINLNGNELRAWVKTDKLEGNRFVVYGILKEVVKQIITPFSVDEIMEINYGKNSSAFFHLKNISIKYFPFHTSNDFESVELSGNLKLYETGEVFGILHSS